MSESGCVIAPPNLNVSTRRRILWLALLAPVPLAVLGFVQGGLFTQDTWDPDGLQRMLTFAAGFALWATLLAAWRRAFVPATIAVTFAFTIFAVGLDAPLAVCVFLAASLAAGDALGRGKLPTHIATLLGIAGYATLMGLLVQLPVNYPLTYAALFAAPIVLNGRALLVHARAAAQTCNWIRPGTQYASLALLAFILALHWLVTLKPEGGSDALAMHLVAPARVAMEHRWPFDVSHIAWAVMPMNANWCYTAVYLFGGEFATRLLNFAMLLLTVWILVSVAGRVAGILFASTPLVQFVTGSLMVENFWTALVAGSAMCVYQRHFLTGGVLGGAAVASKFGAAGFAVPLVAIALYHLARRREWRMTAAAALSFLSFAAPPYLNAYLRTGNPVYPFANATFKAPYIDTQESVVDGRFQEPIKWRTLYDLSFFSSRFYEGRNGAAGFQHVLLLPLALTVAALTRNRFLIGLALLCAVFIAVTFRAQSNLRYLHPAVAACAVLIALAIDKVRGPFLHSASAALVVAAALLNVYFLPASNWSHRDFYPLSLVSEAGRDEYLIDAAPARLIVERINQENADGPVGFFEASDIAGLRAKAYVHGWHNWAYWRNVMGMRSPLEYLKYAQDLGMYRWVAPADLSGGGFGASPAGDFLDHFTDREMVAGRLALYRLSRDFTGVEGFERAKAVELIAHTSAPGTYDDTDQRLVFEGAWTFDYHFTEPSNGTIAYAKQAGATVAFAFQGTSLDYVHTKAANRGVAEVWIDGQKAASIDLYSQATLWQAATTFTDLSPGRHEVKIRVTGRRNEKASDAFVDVDGFVVR